MSDQGNYGGGTADNSGGTADNSGGLATPPTDSHPEKLTDQQRLTLQKGVFVAPASTVHIPMLNGVKNWDHWYNSLLGMCEMADIDGILTGEDEIPIQGEKESITAYNNRCIYWKTANKYVTGSIRSSLKPAALANITGISNAHQMLEKLKGAYKTKGYTSREVLWRTLSRTSYDSCKNITEWVETIKKAKTGLTELESKFPQWIITTTFLHGLPPSYDSFVEIILNSRGKDATGRLLEPEFDEVCDKVLDRERRQQVIAGDANKALKATNGHQNSHQNGGSKSNNNGNRNRTKTKCEKCEKMHLGPCYLAHPEQAPAAWRDANNDRIAEFQKKKEEAK